MIFLTELIGVPFKDGGRDYTDGLDCYGLAQEVFKRYGIDLPDFTICCEEAERIDGEITEQRPLWLRCDENNLPVPCLVVIRFNQAVFCNHTGVYIGNGMFIHTRQKIGVNIEPVDSLIWKRRIEGFYVPSKEVLCRCKQKKE